MGRPAGSGKGVRERSTGVWEGRARVGGRDVCVYGSTAGEAQERLRAAMVAADNGAHPVASRVTVAAYLEQWLAGSVAVRCRPSTVSSYAETVKRYIAPRAKAADGRPGDYLGRPSLGRIALAKLSPDDVSRMLAALTARGDLSPTTVRYAYAVLRIALGRALKQGKVVRNVATLVDAPAKVRRELRPLTAEQARGLIAGTAGDPTAEPPVPRDRQHALYALAVATGMRQGELLALRWEDVDLEAGAVAVRHTLQRRTKDLAEPKTDRARRVLVLGSGAVAGLREHRRLQREEWMAAARPWTEQTHLFTTSVGTPLDSRNVTQDFQKALERLGLPRQRFHDLRHAYATLMLEDGEELAVVSRALGHADLSTTADVYAHLTPAMRARAAARMDRILAPRSAASAG